MLVRKLGFCQQGRRETNSSGERAAPIQRRALVAAKLPNMRQGERTDIPSIEGRSISQDIAATMLNVGRASVERAKSHGIGKKRR